MVLLAHLLFAGSRKRSDCVSKGADVDIVLIECGTTQNLMMKLIKYFPVRTLNAVIEQERVNGDNSLTESYSYLFLAISHASLGLREF